MDQGDNKVCLINIIRSISFFQLNSQFSKTYFADLYKISINTRQIYVQSTSINSGSGVYTRLCSLGCWREATGAADLGFDL